MTTYTTIADTEIDQDSPVTETVLTKLRDNPIAITEGASGAPKVQTAGINDAAVTQVKISTTLASYAGSIPAEASVNIATPNSYSFFPEWSNNGNIEVSFRSGGLDALRLFNSDSSGARSYSVTWRYVNA